MKEINETHYTITNWDGSVDETTDKSEARLALREGRDVIKNTRKLFYSGQSHVRLYISTPIKRAKDL